MVGGDFETVRGAWGVRGEVAYFVDDELQSTVPLRGVHGRSLKAASAWIAGRADYRLAGNVLLSHRSSPTTRWRGPGRGAEGTDVTLVVAADRNFARETRTLRSLP